VVLADHGNLRATDGVGAAHPAWRPGRNSPAPNAGLRSVNGAVPEQESGERGEQHEDGEALGAPGFAQFAQETTQT
jgi:hypothetical protein